MAPTSEIASTNKQAVDVDLPVHIIAMGRYLPSIVLTNADIEAETGIPVDVMEKYLGVEERRRCDTEKGERSSTMAARAIEDACERAGIKPCDLDLIINASGSTERVLPDVAPIIQKELGLSDLGIPCFSVHATCLSFVVATNLVANLLQSGIYKKIAVVSSENVLPEFLEKDNMHTYPLFGSVAVAAIFSLPPEGSSSKMTRYYMETFGNHSDLCTLKVGTSFNPLREGAGPRDICFKMDGPNLLAFAKNNFAPLFEKVQTGLAAGQMGDIKLVVPHQASGNGIKLLERVFGKANVATNTFKKFGNTLAASIPNALFEAIEEGRVGRGDCVLLVGTGAGLSAAALKLIY